MRAPSRSLPSDEQFPALFIPSCCSKAASRLAGLAPKDVSALQFGSADRGPTHPARVPSTPIYVGARPAGAVRRCTVVVLGADHDDLAAPQTDFHQVHQVDPRGSELGFTNGPPGSVRVDAVAEQQLVPVDVTDAGDDRLVHQQRADWPARLGDPRPRPSRVGVATKRIRPEARHHIGDLRVIEKLANRRSAQIGAVFGADHSHPHLSDRSRHRLFGRPRPFGEGSVQPEMYMHRRATDVVVEQVLTPRAGASEHLAVDRGRRRSEPTLWARDRHCRTGISTLVQPGESMQGMPFGHTWS
jgi:hypothetical protein